MRGLLLAHHFCWGVFGLFLGGGLVKKSLESLCSILLFFYLAREHRGCPLQVFESTDVGLAGLGHHHGGDWGSHVAALE